MNEEIVIVAIGGGGWFFLWSLYVMWRLSRNARQDEQRHKELTWHLSQIHRVNSAN